MAIVELEFITDAFSAFASFILAKVAIPVPTFPIFGPTRLLSQPFTFGLVTLGEAPPGFSVPPGTVALSAPIAITHVSIAELIANPSAPGVVVNATAWMLMTLDPGGPHIDLLRIEVPGQPAQNFTPPLFLGAERLPKIEDVEDIRAAAILLDKTAEVVTMRLAVGANDNLFAPPLNILADAGTDNWLIRVSGEVFADRVLRQLVKATTPPPDGTSIEEAPTAVWYQQTAALAAAMGPGAPAPGQWAVLGGVGLEKKDACADVDMSVSITTTLAVVHNKETDLVDLTLRVASDASDWDTFRCWVSTGGPASILVAIVGGIVAGIMTAVESLILIGEFVRLEAGGEVTSKDVGDGFTRAGGDETTVWYTGSRGLPVFPNGVKSDVTVGPNGLVVRGNVLLGKPVHRVTFQPNGGALTGRWNGTYNCREHRWNIAYNVSSIVVSDLAGLTNPTVADPNGFKVFSGNGVRIFPTTVFQYRGSPQLQPVSINVGEWYYDAPSWPTGSPIITPRRTSNPAVGERVMFFLHTSAGLRRFDIGPVAPVDAQSQRPSDIILGLHEANCKLLVRQWNNLDELKWLVDPPPLDYGMPPLRQWMFTFRQLPAAAAVVFRKRGSGSETHEQHTFGGASTGVVEIVTDADVDLVVEHHLADSDAEVRVLQRWLVPTARMPLGGRAEALALSSAKAGRERTIVVRAAGQVMAVDHQKLVGWGGELAGRKHARKTTPRSLSLANGSVAAVHGDGLVIAVPWGGHQAESTAPSGSKDKPQRD